LGCAVGEGEADWADGVLGPGQGYWVGLLLGLGFVGFSSFLFLFTLSFLFLIQTKFEFKYKFEFKPHSNN
jgi:hypothetical protein